MGHRQNGAGAFYGWRLEGAPARLCLSAGKTDLLADYMNAVFPNREASYATTDVALTVK